MRCGHWMDLAKQRVGSLMVIMSLNNMPTAHDTYFLQPLVIQELSPTRILARSVILSEGCLNFVGK